MVSVNVVLEDKVAPSDAGNQAPGIIPGTVPAKQRYASRIKPILFGIFPYFEITFIATHIWTVIIAFHYGGFLMGIAGLILPGPAEVYWIFKLMDDQPVYTATAIFHLLLVLPMKMARNGIPY